MGVSTWIPNKGDIVQHSSGFFRVFARAKNKSGAVMLWDCDRGNPSAQSYPLEECTPVSLDSLPPKFAFRHGGMEFEVVISQRPDGSKMLSMPAFGKGVLVSVDIDLALEAAKKLARAFDGSIFSEEAA